MTCTHYKLFGWRDLSGNYIFRIMKYIEIERKKHRQNKRYRLQGDKWKLAPQGVYLKPTFILEKEMITNYPDFFTSLIDMLKKMDSALKEELA